MKIQDAHYQKLETACKEVLAAHPAITVEAYAAQGLSAMRFNFDVLWACKIDGKTGNAWICSELYPYMNDEHIGTALKRIMGNDGLNRHGKLR